MCYTNGMKTAVSLPDKVFREADLFARRAKKSRSKLYSEAIAEYLLRHSPDSITDDLNRVQDRTDNRDASFIRQAAKSALSGNEW